MDVFAVVDGDPVGDADDAAQHACSESSLKEIVYRPGIIGHVGAGHRADCVLHTCQVFFFGVFSGCCSERLGNKESVVKAGHGRAIPLTDDGVLNVNLRPGIYRHLGARLPSI